MSRTMKYVPWRAISSVSGVKGGSSVVTWQSRTATMNS